MVLGLVAWGCLALGAAQPMASAVRAVQRPRNMLVDIAYDLAGTAGARFCVDLELSEDGGTTYRLVSQGLNGDVGRNVAPGSDKRIVWEPGVDWLGRTAQIKFRITVRGSRPVAGMVWIEPGTFLMGSPSGEKDRRSDEGPQSKVSFTRGFWLAKYEMTQGEWKEVMGVNPSSFRGSSDLPVENVTWTEAMQFCRLLTQRERQAGRLTEEYQYTLPTEAQWEYACRGGTTGATAFGESLNAGQANFNGNEPYGRAVKGPYLRCTAKVGTYRANGWGLYDMHGNVAEWCLDWYGSYVGGSTTNPARPGDGSDYVSRGGSFLDRGSECRSASRGWSSAAVRWRNQGFRIALVAVP